MTDSHLFSTEEVRWFGKGDIPPDIEHWYQRVASQAQGFHPRDDYYLFIPDGSSLGIKLRDGRIEIKQCIDDYGVVRLHDRVSGVVEQWRKWSFDLANQRHELPAGPWLTVTKIRRVQKFRLVNAELIPVQGDEFLTTGCHFELTTVRWKERVWWTVGFEAFGNEASLHDDLLNITRMLFTSAMPPLLNADSSFGYPQWFRRIRRT